MSARHEIPGPHEGATPKARIVGHQDGGAVILNKVLDPAAWDDAVFAGQLIHVQAGTDVHAVMQSLEDDTAEFFVQSLNVGEQARVLKGALYFAVVENHVGLIEGQQVRGRTLERYLTALFQKAGELEAGQAIVLNSKFMAGDGKELDASTEVTVAAKPNRGGQAPHEQIMGREAGQARDEGSTVFDVLRTLGWSGEAVESLKAEVPDDGWIEGFFRVFIKEKRRTKKPISRATINEALRNVDAADLGLRGDGTEKNGIVKLSVQRPIATHGSLLDPADAMEQIVNALREWATAGRIDCRFDG
ncbi:hypothetical protein [Methylobacterium gnaphalii]|uniref:Uncharacterized protein n=1 Tax=Methylobacterium gnaphalii TaxID=1010610 RepID=A0A512JS40_9HYPH|nr:hypothetical protein [Methylobacterium gnaphalii]GEP12759.1 hypothetical protein MGN01_46040 [Methylobacterium gnaphalii]GJD70503.1 hypothetical protein MMMDOFMJ_3452 [Methylobacterium gnaphalii]GLS49142.1 hypothetical protein GCM10007885_19900 [Methylobacterium gnaphalii]